MEMIKTPLWAARGIYKSFPGVQALDNVSIELFPGEVHALLGENGSGKSTLAKVLAGVFPPEAGEIFYQGRPQIFRDPTEARQGGVATIYQEFSLVPTLSVAENIYLGSYKTFQTSGLIDWTTIRSSASEVLKTLALDIDPDAVVRGLSVAEQQLVEIAKAISMESTLLIMDEPTAALGLIETEHLMNLIRRLKDRNKAIIYISHRLDEVFQIADRVTIVKDGQKVGTAPISDMKMRDVVTMMVGFDIEQHYPKEIHVQPEVCLEVRDLTTANGVNDVSFDIRRGEVFGLGGMLGSGRSEIALAIYGVDRVKQGSLKLNGKEKRFKNTAEAIKAGIGLIPENRKVDGSFFNFEGPKNITISRMTDVLRGPFLNLGMERSVGETYVKKLDISPAALERSVQYLSGGNQQKVIIARWLFSQARLLIMDEPTQGIDIGAKLDVYRVINELTANGISVLLISSDFPELLAMSDRVAVVRDGCVLQIAEAAGMTEIELISLASGVGVEEETGLIENAG
ncbi:MAG: sugar ABC transporter ATP-binding protein [Anaerolineaceae bacterium]